eukprot:832201-Rhodomonas_salina.1
MGRDWRESATRRHRGSGSESRLHTRVLATCSRMRSPKVTRRGVEQRWAARARTFHIYLALANSHRKRFHARRCRCPAASSVTSQRRRIVPAMSWRALLRHSSPTVRVAQVTLHQQLVSIEMIKGWQECCCFCLLCWHMRLRAAMR